MVYLKMRTKIVNENKTECDLTIGIRITHYGVIEDLNLQKH